MYPQLLSMQKSKPEDRKDWTPKSEGRATLPRPVRSCERDSTNPAIWHSGSLQMNMSEKVRLRARTAAPGFRDPLGAAEIVLCGFQGNIVTGDSWGPS
ncbi:Inhibitor Of Bruton Tyrosine Kinase [Manis pentadactyla]|nr:Inhibitor Of Bruton Tyrosine Kinase [Manis pentadactyla]